MKTFKEVEKREVKLEVAKMKLAGGVSKQANESKRKQD